MAPSEFLLLGDAVWLDFVNTARGREPCPPDLLADVDAYTRWARLLELDPGTDVPFTRIRDFRHQLGALADALAAGLAPPAAAVTALNAHLARFSGVRQLTRVNGRWRLQFAAARPLQALEAIARTAATTLADHVAVVRRCAGETCSLFIVDATPTGSRRFCDPAVCGRTTRVERRRGLLR